MKANELEVMRLATRQHGVISRSQVLRLLNANQVHYRLNTGAWQRVFPSVYRVEGTRADWYQQLSALSLWAEQGFAFSHHTAAALHGFRRFRRGALELTLTRHLRAPPHVVLHQAPALIPADLHSVQGFRVTSVTRTLMDLAAVLPAKDLRASIDEALSRKWTSLERLAVATQRLTGVPGVRELRALLHQLQGGDGPCESELEARVYEVLLGSGLPRPVKQRPVYVAGRLRRLDFCYPAQRLVIEADGYATHASPLAFEKDRARANSLTARGYRVLQWTWASLHRRPGDLLFELASLLSTSAPAACT